MTKLILGLTLGLAAVGFVGGGCAAPPKDTGIQANNLKESTELMAQSLLALPELNDSSKRWLIVTGEVKDQTTGGGSRSYQMFVDSLKTSLARQGRGRVQLIENRDAYRDLQSKELEPTANTRDDFGQGGGTAGQPAPGPAGIQPDYTLYAKVADLPNNATNFYRFDFTLTSLRDRTIVWNDAYEVRVPR
jgi:hypothetical protein